MGQPRTRTVKESPGQTGRQEQRSRRSLSCDDLEVRLGGEDDFLSFGGHVKGLPEDQDQHPPAPRPSYQAPSGCRHADRPGIDRAPRWRLPRAKRRTRAPEPINHGPPADPGVDVRGHSTGLPPSKPTDRPRPGRHAPARPKLVRLSSRQPLHGVSASVDTRSKVEPASSAGNRLGSASTFRMGAGPDRVRGSTAIAGLIGTSRRD
jgi:hypothetical protein